MSDSILAAIHGGLLAFGLILPLGPQNLFVFTSGASNTLRRAMVVASAAALSDTLLITLGVLGVSAAALEAPGVKTGMLSFGVLFLFYLGWVTWRKPHPVSEAEGPAPAATTLRRQVVVAFCASLLNPHAILDTVAVIGSSSLQYGGSPLILYTLASIGVSWCWFAALVLLGRNVGRIPHVARASNKLSALAMWGCAAFLLTALLT